MQSSAGDWQSFVEYAELSDVGLRRANNQDSSAVMLAGNEVDFFRRGHLFMVADGMGRHAAGELASKISTDTVPLEYFKQPLATPPAALRYALEEGNRRIFARGHQNPDFKGMGTTTSVLVLLPQGALVGHVGDSRVYRLRENRLEQLSFDHSVVWEMQAVARSTGAEMPSHIPKNFITRSLGHDVNVKIDVEGPFPLASGDTFLLCSDGLSGQVGDDEIGIVLSCLKPADAARVLIDLANLRGGPDNITVIVAKVGDLSRVNLTSPPRMAPRGLTQVAGWVWGGLGLSAALAWGFFLASLPLFGTVSAAATAVCAIVAAVQALDGRIRTSWSKTRYGRGPHTSQVCDAEDEFIRKVTELIAKLRESSVQQRWSIDWSRCDQLCRLADDRRRLDGRCEAVRHYCTALSAIMTEIRKQRPAKSQEVVIEDEA